MRGSMGAQSAPPPMSRMLDEEDQEYEEDQE